MFKVDELEIRNRLLCEDVRMEASKKLILIGVFPADIVVAETPARVALAIYMDGQIKTPGEREFFIRYSGPGKGKVVIVAQFTTTKENERVTMVIPRADITFECAGIFKVEVSADEKRWKTAIEKNVIVTENLSAAFPIALRPPSERSLPAAQES